MSALGWIILSFVFQIAAPILNPKGYQKGKLITMPMRRYIRWFDTIGCRLKQLFVLFIIDVIMRLVGVDGTKVSIFFSMGVIVLYLDDYMTNDDNLKRWMKELRNKIKWKMELPQPVPARSGTGS